MQIRVKSLLAGRAATEIVYGKVDVGASSDMDRAIKIIRRFVIDYGACGLSQISTNRPYDLSDNFKYNQELAISSELEKYYQESRQILIKNKDLLDKLVEKLKTKKLLLEDEIYNIVHGE